MTVFTGIILYFMIYWLVIFMVLPFGNRRDAAVVEGNVHGAPDDPRMKRKFIVTAFVAAALWLLVFTLVKMDVIDFYDIARRMSEEDLAE